MSKSVFTVPSSDFASARTEEGRERQFGRPADRAEPRADSSSPRSPRPPRATHSQTWIGGTRARRRRPEPHSRRGRVHQTRLAGPRLVALASRFQGLEIVAIPRPVACSLHREEIIERADFEDEPLDHDLACPFVEVTERRDLRRALEDIDPAEVGYRCRGSPGGSPRHSRPGRRPGRSRRPPHGGAPTGAEGGAAAGSPRSRGAGEGGEEFAQGETFGEVLGERAIGVFA